MQKFSIGIVIILIIVGGYFMFSKKPTPTEQIPSQEKTVTEDSKIPAPTEISTPKTVTFDMNGGNFYFAPTTLKVSKGDTVKINFKNEGGMHDFVIDAFNVKTAKLQSGQNETVTFIANQTGSFEYYCSVGSHRAMGMKGTLIVE